MTQHHPPVAPIHPQRIEAQGDVRIDNYFWLRNRTDPTVLDYLHAENAYTAAVMQHTERLQAQLYQEMRSRIQETDLSVPVRLGDYFYYQRTEEGQQYPIHCRKFQQMTAPEEVLLDVNELAVGHEYTEIGNFQVSPDQRLLAYSLDTAGDEIYTLYVKDLVTGALLSERIPNTYYGLEWGNDNRTIFYTVLNAAKRAYRVFRHQLGQDASNDELVYEEVDDNFHLYLHKSKSEAYILIALDSPTTSEVWFLAADQPTGAFRVVQPRQHGVEYSVTHHSDHFFITTNDQATTFRVVTAPVVTPDKAHWQEMIAPREEVTVERTEAFRHHLVIYEREGGLRHLRIRHLATGEDHHVALPDAAYSCNGSWNPEFEQRVLRFTYSSLVTPESVYDYDMDQRTLTLLKQEAVLGGYNASHYHTARLWATAADGVQVPITIVHRHGVALDGSNPLLLRGYGSYGSNNDPEFTANLVSLLDRGFVFALAHIRGGGEMGRRWYENGKLLHKKNTFTDFIACAEHLIAQGYTTTSKLIIVGRSAGGLLMGAVTNLRPDLFAGVIAGVPFVDVINTMLDPSIPLTTNEYEEWGNPANPAEYAYMRSYSPYDNLEAKAYPHILATAGLNDPRVSYWEPVKWVARLRTLKTNDTRLLLKTNMAAGHSGSSGRFDYLKEVAFEYAFMLDIVGLAA